MSPRERANHSAQLEARRNAGETVGKARKKRSDAGTTRKRNAGDKESAPRKKRQLGKGTAPKSSEFVDTSDEEEEDEGEADVEDEDDVKPPPDRRVAPRRRAIPNGTKAHSRDDGLGNFGNSLTVTGE